MTLKHIKTIVTDMDGTALTSTKELHPITLEAFAEWQAQGVRRTHCHSCRRAFFPGNCATPCWR